jgi:hypothetical protein
MRRLGIRVWLLATAVTLLLAASAEAQPNGQLWGDVTLSWPQSQRLKYQMIIEPKFLVIVPQEKPDWVTLDLTPTVDYAAAKWMDAVGEFLLAPTVQTNEVNSVELTTRAGIRVHLLSRAVPTRVRDRERTELPPSRRLVIRDLARVEQRNIFYSDAQSASSSWRLRNRLEFEFPLNRANMALDGARYLLADWEWFIPLSGNEPPERFASKQRIRAGFGFRRDVKWRYEALYIWGRSLDTTTNSFTTSDNIISLKVMRVF